MNTSAKGIVMAVAAAISYGLNPMFALPLYEKGMTTDSVLFYRYAIAALILAILVKLQKQSFRLNRKEFVMLLAVGIIFGLSSLFLFESFHYIDSGVACTILFVYPVMVALIMFLFFKEKLSQLKVVCIILAMCGIWLLYKGNGTSGLNPVGMAYIMASALSYAIYMVAVSQSVLKHMNTSKLTFYAILFGLVVYIIRLDGLVSLQAIPDAGGWMSIIGIAVIPTVISLICIAAAIHSIGSTLTAIIGALEPVTALLIGVMFFHEEINSSMLLGVFMILGAVSLIVLGKTFLKKTRHLTSKIWNRREF